MIDNSLKPTKVLALLVSRWVLGLLTNNRTSCIDLYKMIFVKWQFSDPCQNDLIIPIGSLPKRLSHVKDLAIPLQVLFRYPVSEMLRSLGLIISPHLMLGDHPRGHSWPTTWARHPKDGAFVDLQQSIDSLIYMWCPLLQVELLHDS